MSGRLAQAIDYFQSSLSITREQAAGIVGNLFGESGLDPTAVGDGGKAYGIAQWHPDRQAKFKRIFGIDIRQSTFEQQLQFVKWELQNTEKNAFEKLLGTGTIAEATRSFMKNFERPADWAMRENLPGRIKAANEAAGVSGEGGSITDSIIEGAKSVGDFITPDWIQNIFNGETGARWIAVTLGVLLIVLAIAAFLFGNVEKIKSAAMDVAT